MAFEAIGGRLSCRRGQTDARSTRGERGQRGDQAQESSESSSQWPTTGQAAPVTLTLPGSKPRAGRRLFSGWRVGEISFGLSRRVDELCLANRPVQQQEDQRVEPELAREQQREHTNRHGKGEVV